MGAISVVVEPPCLDLASRFDERLEPIRIEAFFAKPSIEGLDDCVLHGFPRLDEVELDPLVTEEKRVLERGQFDGSRGLGRGIAGSGTALPAPPS